MRQQVTATDLDSAHQLQENSVGQQEDRRDRIEKEEEDHSDTSSAAKIRQSSSNKVLLDKIKIIEEGAVEDPNSANKSNCIVLEVDSFY